jgi:hypothetical protein
MFDNQAEFIKKQNGTGFPIKLGRLEERCEVAKETGLHKGRPQHRSIRRQRACQVVGRREARRQTVVWIKRLQVRGFCSLTGATILRWKGGFRSDDDGVPRCCFKTLGGDGEQ